MTLIGELRGLTSRGTDYHAWWFVAAPRVAEAGGSCPPAFLCASPGVPSRKDHPHYQRRKQRARALGESLAARRRQQGALGPWKQPACPRMGVCLANHRRADTVTWAFSSLLCSPMRLNA